MNQNLPNSGMEENNPPPLDIQNLVEFISNSSTSPVVDVNAINYDLTELTWGGGFLGANNHLQTPCLPNDELLFAAVPPPGTWEMLAQSGGTLESVVNEATKIPCLRPNAQSGCPDGKGDEFPSWFENRQCSYPLPAASPAFTRDGTVPCSSGFGNDPRQAYCYGPSMGNCVMGCSATYPGSCSGASVVDAGFPLFSVATPGDPSVSGSATFGRDSHQLTLGTRERELITLGSDSPSLGSPESSSSAKQSTKTVDEGSVCHSRNKRGRTEGKKKKAIGKSSIRAIRSKAAAVHSQSERKRRDKINEKIKILQKLVPNSSKTDKASMLEEVIEYLKTLKAAVNIMLMGALQQQVQMCGGIIGMNMNHMMDLYRHNIAGIPPAFPATSWNGFAPGDLLATAAATPSSSATTDPLAGLFAWQQSQPMTLDAYALLRAFVYQQFEPPTSGP